MHFRRIGQIGPGSLQPPLAYVLGKVVAYTFEEFLQIALGNSLHLRDARRRQFGIVQPAFDGLANPVLDRCLRRRMARIRYGRRVLMRKSHQEVDETLCDRTPFCIDKCFQGSRGRVEHTRDHAGETARRDDAGLAKP